MDPLSIVIAASALVIENPKPIINFENTSHKYEKTIENLQKINCDKDVKHILCDINRKNKSTKN